LTDGVLVLHDVGFVEGGHDFTAEDLQEQRVGRAGTVDLADGKNCGVCHGGSLLVLR
jgi:hypothetical protein